MKKTTIILLLFALLLSVTLAGCLGQKNAATPAVTQGQNNQAIDQTAQTNQTETAQTQNADNDNTGGIEKITGGITQLLGLNKSIKCTWDDSKSEDKIVGEVFLAGDKYYQEVTFPDNGKFFALTDSEYFYTWNTRVPGGTKAKLDKTKPGDINKTVTGAAEDNNYTCVPWVVDASKFTAPSDVVFTDNTEEMNKLQGDINSIKQNPCESCDSIQLPELKAKCRQELKCAE